MSKLEKKEQIYPEKFFALPHPLEPWISIQFRTTISSTGPIHNKDHWEEITLNPSNHFDNIKIDDNGGFQKVSLSLHDKNFTRIENIITKSILAARMANVLEEERRVKDDTGYFELKINNNTMINMRIRFGYSSEGDFIDDTIFQDKYNKRINQNIPVIRSPWIYFQILNTVFNVSDFGLNVAIDAFSTADSFLNRAKILKKFAVFRGEPKDIIETLGNILYKQLSDQTLKLEMDDFPQAIENEDGSTKIDINLGGSPAGGESWRSLRSVLNEICGKIPPRIYTAEELEKKNVDNPDEAGEKMTHTVPYTYYLEQLDQDGIIKSIIHFHYPDPIGKANEQKMMRTYIWRENPMSIVKGLTIESRTDFASLNRQIITRDGTQLKCHVAKSANKTETASGEMAQGNLVDITRIDVEKAFEDYDISFTSNAMTVQNSSENGKSAIIAQQVVNYLNQGVFNGALSIPGDPFYLFDTALKPFQYVIKIVVMRPEYIDENGGTIQESISYLSGIYNIKTISHGISNSGFETTLNVIRWPGS